MKNCLVNRAIGAFVALACLLAPFLMVTSASAQSTNRNSTVGVVVDPPPPTSAPRPPAGSGGSGSNDQSAPDSPGQGSPATTNPPTVNKPIPQAEAPQAQPEQAPLFTPKGVMDRAGDAARKVLSGIASGRPVADVLNEVLPEEVAKVIVPAVRTASTFVFPIGLAVAVFAFLLLQQRIDSSDPKLSAAPLAHDDDTVEFR